MTTVKLIFNPFDKKSRLFYENNEITAMENKVYAFLQSGDFCEVLLPFNKRYVIWRGLLPELMNEVNDSELHIIFEGRESDFIRLEQAFDKCRPMIESMGYENQWHLSFIKNFEAEDILDKLIQAAESIRDMCETRAELHEADAFITNAVHGDIQVNYLAVRSLLEKHQEKWRYSTDRYKKEKIDYLNMVAESIKEISNLLKIQEVYPE